MVIVPFAITASYWPRLTSAAVPVGGRHIRNPSEMLRDAVGFSSSALAVFAVDLALAPRADLTILSTAAGRNETGAGGPGWDILSTARTAAASATP